MEQELHFCTTRAGARIAYATVGEGPPLVVVPGAVSHLEVGWMGWQEPGSRYFWETLAAHHRVVRFDRYGCGLSDRNRTDFTMAADTASLEAVIADLKLKRFALMGISASGPVAIAYAAAYPRRVSHLILYGTGAGGWTPTPERAALMQALQGVVSAHWGMGAKLLADFYYPTAGSEERERFAQFQRAAATNEMAVQLLSMPVDVRALTGKVRVPTLVLHRRDDQAALFVNAMNLASSIANARFVALEGSDHVPTAGDTDAVLRPIGAFLGDPVSTPPSLTPSPGTPQLVFISYAAEDAAAAQAVAQALETAGVRCWIAPRDIAAGVQYAEAIVDAIDASQVMVVLFSPHSKRSPHVLREVEQAVSAGLTLVPTRLVDEPLGKALRYFFSTAQWFDAQPGALEPYLPQLVATIKDRLVQSPAQRH